MRVRAGTSGYAYRGWKGGFYPAELPDARMLEHYASRLPTVEINSTFYRLPSARTVSRWIESLPEEFSLVLKASRRITHHARLRGAEELIDHLAGIAERLGRRFGAHLFQLPPYARLDLEGLAAFLQRLPREQRAAFEFRHDSWFVPETYELLRAHDAALVIVDGGKVAVPREATAGWGYLRLRADGYTNRQLSAWARFVHEQAWDDTWVFFKHEERGDAARAALAFMQLARN